MKKDLQQLFTEFASECQFTACLRPETVRGYTEVFKLFLRVMPEVTDADTLTTPMLNEFFKRIETRTRVVGKGILKTGVKKSTIRTQWTKLNVFFEWLIRKRYLVENPLGDIKPPNVRYDDFKRLENDEVNKMYSAIVRGISTPLAFRRDTMMVSLLLYLGLRRGELISLQVKDIDIYRGLITIRGETSKSKKSRTLPMHPTLLMHIKDYLRERDLLGYKTEFLIASTKKDKALSKDGLKHWVERLEKSSGVDFHLHQFRHTFACKVIEGGTPSLALQKLMGHNNISMTERYTRSLKAEDMYESIARITI